MERILKALPWFFVAGFLVSLFTAFVLQNLWNWFAIPALHVSGISFWTMYGFTLIISLFQSEDVAKEHADNIRWETLSYVGELCLSADQFEKVKEFTKEKTEGEVWKNGISFAFGKVIVNGFTLVVGWGVHEFLV